jgi:hypothetical protein
MAPRPNFPSSCSSPRHSASVPGKTNGTGKDREVTRSFPPILSGEDSTPRGDAPHRQPLPQPRRQRRLTQQRIRPPPAVPVLPRRCRRDAVRSRHLRAAPAHPPPHDVTNPKASRSSVEGAMSASLSSVALTSAMTRIGVSAEQGDRVASLLRRRTCDVGIGARSNRFVESGGASGCLQSDMTCGALSSATAIAGPRPPFRHATCCLLFSTSPAPPRATSRSGWSVGGVSPPPSSQQVSAR